MLRPWQLICRIILVLVFLELSPFLQGINASIALEVNLFQNGINFLENGNR